MAAAIGVRYNFQKSFLNPKIVMDKKAKAQRRVLSQIGAFVRTDARRSIRKRKKISRAGDAPSSHNGILKRGIFFQYSRDTSSVIIGPVKIASVKGPSGQPRTLEEGGSSSTSRSTRGAREKNVSKKIFVGARPFMGPAKDKALPTLPRMWRDSVK